MKKQTQFNPLEHLLFEGITGSNLYGTNTPDTDMDTRGICLPPLNVLLHPFNNFEVQDSGFEEEDRAVYALGKFFKLCADANPNIVELLFVPQSKTVTSTRKWERVLENKNLFLSRKVKFSFTGYSFSQLKSVENHRQWFINPPKQKPERSDFGLSGAPLVSEGSLQALLAVSNDFLRDDVKEELMRERLYRDEMRKWTNYMAWKTNRNPKRRKMEDKFGYDAKYIAHVFRLMMEGKELLLTGNITFPLPYADWLKEVKNGKYQYEEVLEMARGMEQEFEQWYKDSPLPNAANRNAITELYFELLA